MNQRKSFSEIKYVITNKEHKCEVCGEIILKGERTLVVLGYNKRDGYFSNYFHRTGKDCYLDFIDIMEIEPEISEKIRSFTFMGQIEYKSWKE